MQKQEQQYFNIMKQAANMADQGGYWGIGQSYFMIGCPMIEIHRQKGEPGWVFFIRCMIYTALLYGLAMLFMALTTPIIFYLLLLISGRV